MKARNASNARKLKVDASRYPLEDDGNYLWRQPAPLRSLYILMEHDFGHFRVRNGVKMKCRHEEHVEIKVQLDFPR